MRKIRTILIISYVTGLPKQSKKKKKGKKGKEEKRKRGGMREERQKSA